MCDEHEEARKPHSSNKNFYRVCLRVEQLHALLKPHPVQRDVRLLGQPLRLRCQPENNDDQIGITLIETTTIDDLATLIEVFANLKDQSLKISDNCAADRFKEIRSKIKSKQ
jgi:hypothetical protein